MGDIADYLSLLQAARELGVSKSRMEQLVRDGRVKVEWLAGRRFVLRSEVERVKAVPRAAGRPKKAPDADPPPAPKRKGKPAG